jgi:hypothetical protein
MSSRTPVSILISLNCRNVSGHPFMLRIAMLHHPKSTAVPFFLFAAAKANNAEAA